MVLGCRPGTNTEAGMRIRKNPVTAPATSPGMRKHFILVLVALAFALAASACGGGRTESDAADPVAAEDLTEALMPTLAVTPEGTLEVADEPAARALLGSDFDALVAGIADINVKIIAGAIPPLASPWDLAAMGGTSSSANAARAHIQLGCQGCVNHVKCTKCVLWVFCLRYASC